MIIRKATKKDIKGIIKLLYELFSQEKEFVFKKKLHKKGLKKIITNKNIGTIFVAIENNKVIAHINILYTISTALGATVALLEDIIVMEQYRDKKIGTKLLHYTINYLKKKENKKSYLTYR